MDNLIKRLSNLLSVKSLVTIILTAVFAYLAITGQVSQEFMPIYTVIVGFYFGSHAEKLSQTLNAKEETK